MAGPQFFVVAIAPVYKAELELIRNSGKDAFKDAAISAGVSPDEVLVASSDRRPIALS